uniref:Uncharacterized protein n=1 Tax=Anopheles minimus TaxID=112268 RepID=A0A182WFY3_9DIPT
MVTTTTTMATTTDDDDEPRQPKQGEGACYGCETTASRSFRRTRANSGAVLSGAVSLGPTCLVRVCADALSLSHRALLARRWDFDPGFFGVLRSSVSTQNNDV